MVIEFDSFEFFIVLSLVTMTPILAYSVTHVDRELRRPSLACFDIPSMIINPLLCNGSPISL